MTASHWVSVSVHSCCKQVELPDLCSVESNSCFNFSSGTVHVEAVGEDGEDWLGKRQKREGWREGGERGGGERKRRRKEEGEECEGGGGG